MSESEGAVIGALLNDPSQWDEAAAVLTVDDFTSSKWRKAWEDIAALVRAGEAVDVFTLAARGHDLGTLGTLQANTTAAGLTRYALTVREDAMRRQGAAVLGDSHKRLLNGLPPLDVFADTQASLEAIGDARSTGYYDTASGTEAALAAIREACEARDTQGMAGVPCGLHPLNSITSGWRKRKLYLLAARPSTGKTSLAMHCAYYAASQGRRVGIIELEMDAQELVSRALASKTGVPYWHLTSGQAQALSTVSATQLPEGVFVDDACRDVARIVARAAEWKRKHDIDLLVIDHLGLVKGGDPRQSRARQLGDISFEFKYLAKRLDIPVLLLCQLNRAVEQRKDEPTLADLRDSGEIEENADVAIFLHCKNREPSIRTVEVGALKNRMGPVGWKGQPLTFDASTQRWKA